MTAIREWRDQARPRRGGHGAGAAAAGRRRRRKPHAVHTGVCSGRGHHRRMGRGAAGGVRRVPGADRALPAPARAGLAPARRHWRRVRARVAATAVELGGARLRLLVGKPGLDGHSNGAEQIAVRARDAGFEVIYQGIRLTPAEIVRGAVEEGVDLVGLSVLSGSHLRAVPDVLAGLRAAGVDVPRGGRRHHPARGRADATRRRGGPGLHARRTSSSPRSSTSW